MTKYRSGDIILLEVVFSEGTGSKQRPALIISSDEYHRNRQEIIISAITSNVDRVLVGDTKLDHWKEAGLLFPSLVTGIIQTMKASLVIRKLGALTGQDLQKVQGNLKKTINL